MISDIKISSIVSYKKRCFWPKLTNLTIFQGIGAVLGCPWQDLSARKRSVDRLQMKGSNALDEGAVLQVYVLF